MISAALYTRLLGLLAEWWCSGNSLSPRQSHYTVVRSQFSFDLSQRRLSEACGGEVAHLHKALGAFETFFLALCFLLGGGLVTGAFWELSFGAFGDLFFALAPAWLLSLLPLLALVSPSIPFPFPSFFSVFIFSCLCFWHLLFVFHYQ